MAVAFQAKGTSQTTSTAATSTTFTKLTVAAGSNLALVVGIVFGGNPGAFTKKNWDDTGTPQALTQILTATESDNLGFAYLFGLVNPNVGAKTLALTWTNSVDFCYDAVSFTGVDQTGGTTTFKNAVSVISSSQNPSLTITSPSGDMGIATFATSAGSFGTNLVTGTDVYLDNTNISGDMRYLLGSGSAVITANVTTSVPSVGVGCDILAAGAAAAPNGRLVSVLQAVKRASYW